MYQSREITTKELIQILWEDDNPGHQISRKSGLLNTTKCIYQKDNLIYLFDVSEKFAFDPNNGFTANEFERCYRDEKWLYEYPIG